MAAANVLLLNLSIPAPDTNKLIFSLPCTDSMQGEEQNPAIIIVWGGGWRWTGVIRRWGLSSCYKGAAATRILRKYFKKIECGLHSWAEHPPHCLVSCPSWVWPICLCFAAFQPLDDTSQPGRVPSSFPSSVNFVLPWSCDLRKHFLVIWQWNLLITASPTLTES